ncbi:MAG: hypothetical protein ACQEWV_29385 [Bacillota bacterium]
MNLKKITPIQGIAITISFVMVLVAFLIAFQTYFSYVEVTEAANGCYDNGGFPIIEKSGFKINYFYCDMD